MNFAYPDSNKSMNGLINATNNNIKFTTSCSSDISFCSMLFTNEIDNGHYWGANQNGYAEIRFKRKSIVISHYSLRCSSYENKPKTIIVKGISEKGSFKTIDYIEESQLTSAFAVQMRSVNNTGPFIGIRFIITKTWEARTGFFSGLHGVALFGSLINRNRATCANKSKSIFHNLILICLYQK